MNFTVSMSWRMIIFWHVKTAPWIFTHVSRLLAFLSCLHAKLIPIWLAQQASTVSRAFILDWGSTFTARHRLTPQNFSNWPFKPKLISNCPYSQVSLKQRCSPLPQPLHSVRKSRWRCLMFGWLLVLQQSSWSQRSTVWSGPVPPCFGTTCSDSEMWVCCSTEQKS